MWRSISFSILGVSALLLFAIAVANSSNTVVDGNQQRITPTMSSTPTPPPPPCTPTPLPTVNVPTITPTPFPGPTTASGVNAAPTTPYNPCQQQVDLIISDVVTSHDWRCFQAPHTIRLHVTVKNIGTDTAPGFFVYANGQAQYVIALAPNTTRRLTFTFAKNPPVVVADSTDAIVELNELNNDWIMNVPVLTLTPPAPCTPTPESTITITPVGGTDVPPTPIGGTISPTPVLDKRGFMPLVLRDGVPQTTRTPEPATLTPDPLTTQTPFFTPTPGSLITETPFPATSTLDPLTTQTPFFTPTPGSLITETPFPPTSTPNR